MALSQTLTLHLTLHLHLAPSLPKIFAVQITATLIVAAISAYVPTWLQIPDLLLLGNPALRPDFNSNPNPEP